MFGDRGSLKTLEFTLAFLVQRTSTMIPLILTALCFINVHGIYAVPTQEYVLDSKRQHSKFYDIQAHRGGRGNTVESTLPSFAWGLIDGATTLELDNGITKDGVVVVWHDENIVATKCKDTSPATPNDPAFPYVGKFIANLTLAQLMTIDCGSLRQDAFPMQLTYPGIRISTLQELFDFAECADPDHHILWNIESKIDAPQPNLTLGVEDFVSKQHTLFVESKYRHAITYQSFDWRTLIAMKKLDPSIPTAALADDTTIFGQGNSTSPWLAGVNPSAFPGSTLGEQVAQAAHSIDADILSTTATSSKSASLDPAVPGYIPFTTKEMIDEAHRQGMTVKPWTVNRLNIVEQLVGWKADGIITDFPNVVRRWAKQQGLLVAPKYPKQRVLACLDKHLKKAG